MELILPWPELIVLLAAGFAAGWVDSIAGGGGLITLPALLMAGLPPHLALGTNKLGGTFGTLSAARVYVRKRVFKPADWKGLIVATACGALLGALATRIFTAQHLGKLLPVLIGAAALYALFPKRQPPGDGQGALAHDAGLSLASGSALGFYDGFSGPGAGAFWTAIAMRLYRLELLEAAGIARFMNLISNAVSLATFIALGSVHFPVGLALGSMLMAGAHVGAHSAVRHGSRLIRPVFTLVVLALVAVLIWREWF